MLDCSRLALTHSRPAALGGGRRLAAAGQRHASPLRSSSLSFSSDEFIQAQQQLARWASEEAVAVEGAGSAPAPRGYFPSPADSSGSEAPRGPLASAFPEYKH